MIIRKIKSRILVSIVSGMLISVLFLRDVEQQMSLAWWGWLYPEYCFMEAEKSDSDSRENVETGQAAGEKSREEVTKSGIKISFWLAKVLDW